METKKRIVAVSDLHGNLPDIPPCDICLIGGDICPATNHSLLFQLKWIKGPFNDWLKKIPAKYKVGIAGNHDFIFEDSPLVGHDLDWAYLDNKITVCDGIKIFGSPYTQRFYDWAFMKEDHKLGIIWDIIPEDIHILMTHGPAYGVGDRTVDGDLTGSRTLTKRLSELNKLPVFVFGHIHEAFGKYKMNDIKCYNVSILDETYQPVNPVTRFTI